MNEKRRKECKPNVNWRCVSMDRLACMCAWMESALGCWSAGGPTP